jgi:hypothetical protein
MQILTLDNTTYLLNKIPDHVDDSMRFSILDNTDATNPDFFFVPLIYLESFSSPAVVLEIGKNKIQMPLDWYILLGDPECGDLEILPLTSLNDRSFHAFCFNPITDSMPTYQEVNVVNIYNEVEWFFPRVRSNHLLTTPITTDVNPPCCYFIKDINRNTDTVDLHALFNA